MALKMTLKIALPGQARALSTGKTAGIQEEEI